MAETKNETSFFKQAIIATPALIGAGLTAKNLYNHYNTIQSNNPIVSASNTVREFASKYTGTDPSILKQQNIRQLNFLSENWQEFGLKNSALAPEIEESIFRIADRIDPTKEAKVLFRERLKDLTYIKHKTEVLSEIARTSNSIYTQKVINETIRDFQWKVSRLQEGLSIETGELLTRVDRSVKRATRKAFTEDMIESIRSIEDSLSVKARVYIETRKDLPGAEKYSDFFIKFHDIKYSDKEARKVRPLFSMRVPRSRPDQPGIVTHGATQQSQYIAGKYGVIDNEGKLIKTFTHEQFMFHRLKEEILPEIMEKGVRNQRAIRNIIHNFEKEMLEDLQWIPSLYKDEHAGISEYIKHRQNIMRLYTKGDDGELRKINEIEQYKIMKQGGLKTAEGGIEAVYPAFSPSQVAKGVVGTQDVRGGMFLVPEAAPYARRPLQYLREGATPLNTVELAQHKLSNKFAWAKANIGVETPMMRAVYVSNKYNYALQNVGFTPEGQTIVDKETMALLENAKSRQIIIDPKQISKEAMELMGDESYRSFGTEVPEGLFLGRDLEGKPITTGKNMRLVSGVIEEDKSRGRYLRFMVEDENRNIQQAKVFGGFKGMVVAQDQMYVDMLLRDQINIDPNSMINKNINTIISMDELKKNRGLHYNQMFTSLWEYTNENIAQGKTKRQTAMRFAENPLELINSMRENAVWEGKFNHEKMLKQMVGLARSAKLNPEQMGYTFGAVPEVFDQGISALGELSNAEISAISKGVSSGVTQTWFEDIGGPGSGKTATIEPRTFELLSSPHFGKMGPLIQEDISKRMIAAYPERLLEQKEFIKSLSSITNPETVSGAVSPSQFINEEDIVLPSKPTYMKVQGVGDIYIPGKSQLKPMSSYMTSQGLEIESDLAKEYESIIEQANKFEAGKITQKELQESLAGLEKSLISSTTGTVTGEGGLLRNRLPGSVFLTGLQPTVEDKLASNVAGITAPYAKKMFSQMKDLGIYDTEAIDTMEKKFMAGERVSGILGRHPYIGQYSSMPMDFQLVAGDQSTVKIGENLRKAVVMPGQVSGEKLAELEQFSQKALGGNSIYTDKLKLAKAEVLSNPIRLSPFVGLAGDVDGDIFSAMFAGPQLQEGLKTHIASQEAIRAYEDHSIRMQLMKSKGVAGNITLREAMAGDVVKLGITGKTRPGEGAQRIGKISSELQQYRASILANAGKLSQEASMDAMSYLEWLEQTPISSKHIQGGKETEMFSLLDHMQTALKGKKGLDLKDITEEVMKHNKGAGRSMINEGLTVMMQNPETGTMESRFIRPIDLEKTIGNIMSSRKAFDATPLGEASGSRIRKTIMDRGGISTGKEALETLQSLSQMEKTPFGGFFPGAKKRAMGSSVEQGLSMMNRLMAEGKSAISLAKPLAIGGAVALGLAAALSEPMKMVPPGTNVAPVADLKSGTGGANLGYGEHPEPRTSGDPSAVGLVNAGNSARIEPKSDNYNIRIEGNTNDRSHLESINSQIRSSMRGGSRVHSSVRDLRSRMTPQRISSIINDD